MNTLDIFKKYIEKITPIEPLEWEMLCNFITTAEYKDKALLDVQGEPTDNLYFMVSGAVRMYRKRDGREYTSNLFTTPRFVANLNSMINDEPADHTLQSLIPTKVAILKFKDASKLYGILPKYEHIARVFLEQILLQEVERISELTCYEPFERFQNLLANSPELMDLVPQKYIASYLGISPESLSRMKAKISQQ